MKTSDTQTSSHKAFFCGSDAINAYLDPKNHPYTPLVELPRSLTPHYDEGLRIYCKMMNSLPLSNVKSIAAMSMMKNAAKSGVNSVVEASSGNTAYSASMIANSIGITDFTALISREVTPSKLRLLRLTGATTEVVDEPICPEPNNPDGAINIARKRGKAEGTLNMDQYSNFDNPRGHIELTAPQIEDQLDGDIDVFVSSLGTTGTIVGCSTYFRDNNHEVYVVGIARKPNNYVPGVRTENLLHEVDFNWQELVDQTITIGTKESFESSLKLIRSGLPVGPSGGFAYAGALGAIEDAIHKKGRSDLNIVFISPDEPTIYIDDYFKYLKPEQLGKIVNEHLLDKQDASNETEAFLSNTIEPADLCSNQTAYDLIDVRSRIEFEDHHIKDSENIPIDELPGYWKELKRAKNEIIFICKSGARSAKACEMAAEESIKCRSLEGGTTNWSGLGYERVRPKYCN